MFNCCSNKLKIDFTAPTLLSSNYALNNSYANQNIFIVINKYTKKQSYHVGWLNTNRSNNMESSCQIPNVYA